MAGAVWLYVNSALIIQPFGFRSDQALYMVLIPLCGFGFVGAILFGYMVKLLKVKKKFKTINIFNSVCMLGIIILI